LIIQQHFGDVRLDKYDYSAMYTDGWKDDDMVVSSVFCAGEKLLRILSVFTVFTVFRFFRLLTDFVCLYNYEFWLSLCKIVRSSVILLLPLFFINISLRQGVLDTKLCDQVRQCLAAGRWFSQGTPVSSTNKTNRHDKTEILLKLVLNTITLTLNDMIFASCKHNYTLHEQLY
jgi:hypothetical protein